MIKEINTGLSCSLFLSDDSLKPLNDFVEGCIKLKRKLFLVCDENTAAFCLPIVKKSLPSFKNIFCIKISSGEKNKTIESCNYIWQQFIENGADKKSVLINLGGGVICDLGGFAASCFKRGINFVHIPTTLLAMTDAALGGKNAINLYNFKNQIGSIVLPKSVFIYTPFLKTLDKRNLKNGFAEMLKHGLIEDKKYFTKLISTKNFTALNALERSVAIKLAIACSDLHETNIRKLLNFGHTIGHAVESHFQTLTGNELMHGEAIAVGMICESFISHKQSSLTEKELKIITKSILQFFPKVKTTFKLIDLLPYLMADKKNVNVKINFTLLNEIGDAQYDFFVGKKSINDSINYYHSL